MRNEKNETYICVIEENKQHHRNESYIGVAIIEFLSFEMGFCSAYFSEN